MSSFVILISVFLAGCILIEPTLQAASKSTIDTEIGRLAKSVERVGYSKYYVGLQKVNYYKAQATCRHLGLFLVSIETQNEQEELEKVLADSGLSGAQFWTSGSDLAEKNEFLWLSTGEYLTYTNWFPGEPNDGSYDGEENCIEIGVTGEWNDLVCRDERNFICEE